VGAQGKRKRLGNRWRWNRITLYFLIAFFFK
jgi:hypothetical protein